MSLGDRFDDPVEAQTAQVISHLALGRGYRVLAPVKMRSVGGDGGWKSRWGGVGTRGGRAQGLVLEDRRSEAPRPVGLTPAADD